VRPGLLSVAIVLVLAVESAPMTAGPPAAGGGPVHREVQALDDHFLPSILEVPPGASVVWTFPGARTHSATDASGLGLFDSGLVAPGGKDFAYRFVASGTYRYVCTLHELMRGRVWVLVQVSHDRRPRGRPFALTWAIGAPPAGAVYDVQLKRPGSAWRAWRTAVTASGATMTPSRPGTFRVRARLRRSSGGAVGWSPPTRFVVT
jgi:plastocyanin